jgi:hypothetical protein
MGDRISAGGAAKFLEWSNMQDDRHTRLCKPGEYNLGPAVPTVGKPGANIEDCAVLAEKLRRRAPYYIDHNEFPHPKHRTLVRYRGCSIGVQMAGWQDTNQWDVNMGTLPFPKAVITTNQDLLEALFEAMANPTVDGKVGMKGHLICPDWMTLYDPAREDYRPRWFGLFWDVYGDQWEDI